MHRSRFTSGAAQLAVMLLCLVPTFAARAGDDPARLNEAIQLFNAGDYVAAQELLAEIDRTQLSPEQQQSRDDYLSRVQIALTMYEKALRDLEDAENAINSNDLARAEELLNQVLNNEYAAEALRRDADQHLRDLSREGVRGGAAPARSEAVQAAVEAGTAPPDDADRVIITETETVVPLEEFPQPREMTPADVDQARALTAEGNSLLREGRNAEAIARYEAALDLVAGYPEAVDGIIAARQHTQIQAGPAVESLAERIRREDQLRWQRTEVQYRDAERIIREHVAAERFEEANQMLVRAQQLVVSGRQFADPPTQYENLRAELDAFMVGSILEEAVEI